MKKTFARDFDYMPTTTVPARESGAPLLAVACGDGPSAGAVDAAARRCGATSARCMDGPWYSRGAFLSSDEDGGGGYESFAPAVPPAAVSAALAEVIRVSREIHRGCGTILVPARDPLAGALQAFLGEEPGRLDGTGCLMFAAPLHQGLFCACGAAAQTSRGVVPLCCGCATADLAPAVRQ